MSSLPIAEYALVSDCACAALISRSGSLDWLCFPRFDGPSCFGRLLDDRAGHWSIKPVGESTATRRYSERTLVLETTFETPRGRAVLVDALAMGANERGHQLGADSPRVLLRRVTCAEGNVELEVEYAPRPEYGLVEPLIVPAKGGLVARGGPDVLFLSSAVGLAVEGSIARGRLTLKKGKSAAFALQHRSSWEPPPGPFSQREIARRLEDTAAGWRSWSKLHQRYEGPWSELVHQSGRILQALTYFPTSAIIAAPTTSLPEAVGGPRNWDYRYSWVRDASLTMEALWVAACPDDGMKFFSFLAAAASSQIRGGADLQIMFGIGGEHDLTERELPHLSGWRNSRPVRIGNGAWNQRQLDVYGELLGAVHQLKDQLGDLDLPTREFLADVADAAASRWKQKDHGIWEVRGPPRDFVHSKLMCWVALDRAIALAKKLNASDRLPRWKEAREEIRRAILDHGFSDRAGAFTQSFGSDALDASNLVMPLVGFLPATDERMLATIRAVADRLTDQHGLVYRYRTPDGLSGEEGTFLVCTFWLAQAQALAGDLARAKDTFSRAAAFANDVGLLSEQVDPRTRELLGNFPQAFSHIGLVNAAWAIAQAEGTAKER
jgi:GH15 family glucan-1,4-alpha-glucosidase